jgi:serine/threonine protein kinase
VGQIEDVGRGTVLSGRYELGSILGKGGMGVVFRGKHLGTDRPIAVKILRREFASDPTLAKRFVREAKAAAALRHPNVVDVLDYGVDPDGTAFQVLELLDGESLREHLERKSKISIELTLALLFPVVHALAMAHARGVIHRDLKPDNVFLARNVHGRIVPKLLDFGIAKVMPKDGGAAATLSTRVGAVMGTPAYMSPEQARGTPDVGTATDVWAIGVILFECLAGRTPFQAETASMLMARIMMEQAPSLASIAPDVPEAVALAIDRALAPKSDQRWPSMDAFATALREAATASGIAVPAVGASDAAPMSLPPPRNEADEAASEGAISSGDDIDIEVDPATRAGRSRRGRAETSAATEHAGSAALPPSVPLGTADTDRPPAPPTKPGHGELAHAATAPRLPALLLDTAPPSPPSRVPLLSVVAVSLVIAAIAIGLWLREPAATSSPPAPPPIAQPVVAPPPIATTIPEPAIVDVPVVAQPPEETEPAVVPRHERHPRTTTAAHATDHASAEEATHHTEDAPHERGSGLPGVSEW